MAPPPVLLDAPGVTCSACPKLQYKAPIRTWPWRIPAVTMSPLTGCSVARNPNFNRDGG
jgi:hypothetical protein